MSKKNFKINSKTIIESLVNLNFFQLERELENRLEKQETHLSKLFLVL